MDSLKRKDYSELYNVTYNLGKDHMVSGNLVDIIKDYLESVIFYQTGLIGEISRSVGSRSCLCNVFMFI